MRVHDAAIVAVTVEGGVILLLCLVPVLVLCTWLILRSTNKFIEESEAVVKSAEESHLAAFLEQNGPAIIRRLGSDGRRSASDNANAVPLIEGEDGVLEVHQLPDDGRDYGRAGIEEEMQFVVTVDTPEAPPREVAPADVALLNPPEEEFKPLPQ